MEDKKRISFDEIGKELPFKIPENYFEDFASAMEAQIVVKPTSLKRVFKPWMYMAAMFVGLFVIGQVLFTVLKTTNVNTDDNYESYILSQVDETALIDYYVENADLE